MIFTFSCHSLEQRLAAPTRVRDAEVLFIYPCKEVTPLEYEIT